MTDHRTGTREEWLAARRELLEAEKRHMRRGDELARWRQELPWVPIGREYVFEAEDGKKTLAELFDGRSQLLVYHFMFGFGFRVDEQNPGCTGCSFVADHFDGVVAHLAALLKRLDEEESDEPWLAVCSFLNPHDIAGQRALSRSSGRSRAGSRSDLPRERACRPAQAGRAGECSRYSRSATRVQTPPQRTGLAAADMPRNGLSWVLASEMRKGHAARDTAITIDCLQTLGPEADYRNL